MRQKTRRHIPDIGGYCIEANSRSYIRICDALGLGRAPSRRSWAEYQGKERGRDGDIEYEGYPVDTTVGEKDVYIK